MKQPLKPMETEGLIGLPALCAALNKTERSVKRLIYLGRIPVLMIGREQKFLLSAVEKDLRRWQWEVLTEQKEQKKGARNGNEHE